MSTSPLETKLSNLQAEVRGAHEKQCWENFPRNSHDARPSTRANRPNKLGDMGAPHTPRSRPTNLSVGFPQPETQNSKEIESKLQEIMKLNGIITIGGKKYATSITQMEDLGELGNGTCGHVVKMRHTPSNTVIAVKQMRRSGNPDENKRIIMDIDVVLKSHSCDYIVKCLGCFITDTDVWICMELMGTCFDKLLKRYREPVPEKILGKVTVATVKALNYLKEEHGVIHRDVKPSNILLDEKGRVKLCDFGISGRLVDSKAKTRSAGCAAYMAPERIDPPDPSKPGYDIRADVWSLGITLVELATGQFPYQNCNTDFEVLTKVLQDDPPSLPEDREFSLEFRNFVKLCLTKNYKSRPKYRKLLDDPFIKKYEEANINVAEWYADISQQSTTTTSTTTTTATTTQVTHATQATQATQATSVSIATSPITTLAHSGPVLAANPPLPSTPQQRRFTPTPPSPSVRRSVPVHYPQHVRSVSETGRPVYPPVLTQHAQHAYHVNGDVIGSMSNGRCSPFNPGASGWPVAEAEATTTIGGRFSPFQSPVQRLPSAGQTQTTDGGAIAAINSLRSSPAPASPAHASWQAQEALAEWNANTPTHRYGTVMGTMSSPHTGRKRFPSEPPPSSYRDHYHPGNTSPLVLQRFYHQQQQHQQQQQQQLSHQEQLHHHLHHHHHHHHHFHHHHPSPSQHLPVETIEVKKADEPSSGSEKSSGKKRFASYLKFSIGSGGGSSSQASLNPIAVGALPPPRPARHASPGPPPPSPDPPPCFSRLMASGDGLSSLTSSPLARRNYVDVSPVRRDLVQGSPSLPRRFVSPTPPQPPPRRLSTEGTGGVAVPSGLTLAGTSSVPGSPQVRRVDNGRPGSRYHLSSTPQPQRRHGGLGGTVDFHDL